MRRRDEDEGPPMSVLDALLITRHHRGVGAYDRHLDRPITAADLAAAERTLAEARARSDASWAVHAAERGARTYPDDAAAAAEMAADLIAERQHVQDDEDDPDDLEETI